MEKIEVDKKDELDDTLGYIGDAIRTELKKTKADKVVIVIKAVKKCQK